MFSLPKDYWVEDIAETQKFLEVELGQDMPPAVHKEVLDQVERIKKMWSVICPEGHQAAACPTCQIK